jgi:tetratricopeptide (TPR) repeat protein
MGKDMKIRRSISVISVLCLLAAAGAAALYLTNRRDVTTSSAAAYRAYEKGLENEHRYYKKDARVDFARAIELDPEFAEAILGLARQAEHEQALSLIERAWTLRDRLTERERLHVDLERAYLLRRFDDLLQIARQIHEKFPDDIRATEILAADESRRGRTEQAVRYLTEILRVDPNSALAYNQIGYFYGYRGDYAKAVDNLKKYQFMAPDQANPLDSLGEVQAYSGHYDEAIESLRRALAIKPDFDPAYEHLAVAYEGKGDYAKAIECYQKAAELAATNSIRENYLASALRSTFYAKDAAAGERIAQQIETLPKSEFSELRRTFLAVARDLFVRHYADAERRLAEFKPKMYAALSAALKGYKPYDSSWNFLMAKCKIAQGKDAEAIPLLEEMINPPNPWGDFVGRRPVYEGRACLAALLAKRGELDRAEKLLAENQKWNASWAPTREQELAVTKACGEKVQTATK